MEVPTKGAEHGVARSVANAPVKKLSDIQFPSDPLLRGATAVFPTESDLTSRNPNKLQENKVSTITKKIRKIGSWNCIPHPTVFPAVCRPIVPKASRRYEEIMPAVEARKLIRTFQLFPPIFCRTPRILIDKTGNTQGMRLRIIPPTSAKPNIMCRGICRS